MKKSILIVLAIAAISTLFWKPAKTTTAESDFVERVADRTDDLLDAADADVVRLEGDDLAVQTRRWAGKIVSARMSCFYADVGDYRCLAGPARVDFTMIMPEAAAGALRRDCDRIRRLDSSACRKTIRFVYSAMRHVVKDDGSTAIMVEAKDAFGVDPEYRGFGRRLYRKRME